MWESIQLPGVIPVLQVLALACVFYYTFLFFRGTRGAQVLVGLAVVLAFLLLSTHFLHMMELNWLLRKFSMYLAVAMLVIFQPEIRRALAELGRQPVFSVSVERRTVIDHVVQAVTLLAEHRIGALIAIEREIGTRAIQETGVRLDCQVVPELLATIFFPHTPLHDGGVIISANRMMAAGCVFPLSLRMDLHKNLGTRHRAAVGLSEETDAVVIVVSEETGTISVSFRGRLSSGLDEDRLRRFLAALLRKRGSESAVRRVQEQLDLTPEGIAKSEKMAKREADGGA